jgi:hypothetical protein
MIETKAESQNYLANPYSSLGPLPFHTDEYVLSVLPLRDAFSSPFMPVTCQTATSEVSFGSTGRSHSPPLSSQCWIVLPIRFINSPFPHALDRR